MLKRASVHFSARKEKLAAGKHCRHCVSISEAKAYYLIYSNLFDRHNV